MTIQVAPCRCSRRSEVEPDLKQLVESWRQTEKRRRFFLGDMNMGYVIILYNMFTYSYVMIVVGFLDSIL